MLVADFDFPLEVVSLLSCMCRAQPWGLCSAAAGHRCVSEADRERQVELRLEMGEQPLNDSRLHLPILTESKVNYPFWRTTLLESVELKELSPLVRVRVGEILSRNVWNIFSFVLLFIKRFFLVPWWWWWIWSAKNMNIWHYCSNNLNLRQSLAATYFV